MQPLLGRFCGLRRDLGNEGRCRYYTHPNETLSALSTKFSEFQALKTYGFSGKAPGGWGFFSVFFNEGSKNKNPTPWGFS